MSKVSPSNADYLSYNPFLCHILCLLDAKQVLRCMRINKQFYNTILNNWQYMQKIELNLTVKAERVGSEISGRTLSVTCNGLYGNIVGDYHCLIRRNHVEIKSSSKFLPVQDLFLKQRTAGRAVDVRSFGTGVVVAAEPTNRLVSTLNILFTKLKIRQPPSQSRSSSAFDGTLATSTVDEGLAIVILFFLSRCNLHSIKLDYLKGEYLKIIADCVRSTGARLLSPVTVPTYSKRMNELLLALGAKEIKIKSFSFWHDSGNLPTNECRVTANIWSTHWRSLQNIINLIEEWHCGKRNIQYLKLINNKAADKFPFTVPDFEELLVVFDRMTVVSYSESDIQVFIGRQCDSKVLLIEYNRTGERDSYDPCSYPLLELGGFVTLQEA